MSNHLEKPPVLSVGRLYCDLIFTGLPRMPTLGTEVFADGFGAHAGGGAFITAAHLAELGHASSLAANLPAPPFRDMIGPDLKASRLDLSLCASLSASEGPQLTVAMAQDADRSFLTRRAGAPFPEIHPDEIAARKIRHLHIGEVTSLIEMPDILHVARSQGATISVDCGWDDDFDANQLKPFVGMFDIFLPNENEMDALKKSGLGGNLAPITVVKLGACGAAVISPDQQLNAPAIAAKVVDTTGAGDAFNAGFLSHWLSGGSLQACLEAGNRRGALAVGTRGGFSAGAARERHG